MLTCNNVTKTYATVNAVKGVSFTVEKGRIYALLGPNGSGKTTLMKMIAGLTKPTAGNITFLGEELNVESKKDIAYMPTEAYFYSYMTCNDVCRYYADFFEDFDAGRFERLMDEMKLSHKDKVSRMSSGMMAKLKIAVTMARNAKLIMLDEPLNGIDIIARDNIINTIISSAGDNKTIIVSSHLVDELERIIDEAIYMKDGQIALMGDVEELRQTRGRSVVDIYKEIYS